MSRTRRPVVSAFLLACTALLPIACRNGGDGSPSIPASVPNGSAQNPIQMVGTWEMRNIEVVDTNETVPLTPVPGTPVVIGPEGIRTIGPISFRQADLESVLALTFDWFVNSADGRRLFYGLSVDRREQGLGRIVLGIAGGSVDANTMAIEHFYSIQANSTSAETFSRFRYILARVSNAVIEPEGERSGSGTPAPEAPAPVGDAFAEPSTVLRLLGRER
jgi:hypothetical protein